MRDILKYWDSIKQHIKGKVIFLFLDFDGTLVPIADTPQQVVMPEENKRLLCDLSIKDNIKLAIISGRSLRDIKGMVGLKGLIYSGNHGLEIEGPQIKHENPAFLKYRPLFKKICKEIGGNLSGIKGVLIEDKGLTLSIHYRLVDKKDVTLVKTIVRESLIMYTIKNKIKIKTGKKVFEITPPVEWDKGKIVLWLLAREKFKGGSNKIIPLYIGDDTTDEDAFRVLKNRGISVVVGKKSSSSAEYYLNDHRSVLKLLYLIREAATCQN